MNENEIMENFLKEYEAKRQTVNNWLLEVMPKAEGDCAELYDAMHHSLFSGGKRIRPIITMAVCEMLGGNVEQCMPFAAAMELIHTYSLIHDDLPAMDDDDMRRGNPACHKKYGEATAILAGDNLLTFAFELMSRAEIEPLAVVECIRTVALAGGSEGMIGGQVLDMKSGERDAMLHQKMNLLKTGALIMASACVGSIIGGATVCEYQAIGNFAKNLGLAFQVKDDILDVEGDSEKLGKNTGADANMDKYTYVSLLGLENAKKLLLELTDEAKDTIAVFGEESFFLQDLVEYLYQRDK